MNFSIHTNCLLTCAQIDFKTLALVNDPQVTSDFKTKKLYSADEISRTFGNCVKSAVIGFLDALMSDGARYEAPAEESWMDYYATSPRELELYSMSVTNSTKSGNVARVSKVL
jgi:hypothetical protein